MIKKKTCKHCGVEFYTQRSTAKACSLECAVEIGRQNTIKKRDKEDRKALKEGREKLMSLSDHAKLTQRYFNQWILLRDEKEPCISCGRHHTGKYHAGHYLSVGSNPELRFDESNVHKQCSVCNTHLSGNSINYRIRLIQKIGLVAVESLETKHQMPRYRVEDYKRIASEYREKIRNFRALTP
jgi:hypothetical protein